MGSLEAHTPTVGPQSSRPSPNSTRKRSRASSEDGSFSDDSPPSKIRRLKDPAPFPVSPLSPPSSPMSSRAHFDAMYELRHPKSSEPELPSVSKIFLEAGMERIKRNAQFRRKNQQASNVNGWDSEDEFAWLNSRQWEMLRDLGIEPTGPKSNIKRTRPRGELYTNTVSQPKRLVYKAGESSATKGASSIDIPPANVDVSDALRQGVPEKRAPAAFPVDFTERDSTPPPEDPLPPLPTTQIFVNPSEWKPRSLSSALEAAKIRKKEEGGDDEWTEEDDLLCFRREQWRMMKAMGIETQETEPKGRWRPGMP